MIEAVTFDLWNTLVHEGPSGLFEPRVQQWEARLATAAMSVDSDALRQAHEHALARYQEAWIRNEQFVSSHAVAAIAAELGLELDEQLRAELAATFVEAGLASDIEIVPGAVACLEVLKSEGRRTAIVCDIGLTPSGALVEHLRRLGCAELVDVFVWSDVTGVYKPSPRAFTTALDALDVAPAQAVHIGDRSRTDIAGAHAAGMRAIRFVGVYDDPETEPAPDAVVDDLLDLPVVLHQLEQVG